MAASNRQMNIRNSALTPQGGGAPIVFNGVESCNFSGGGSTTAFAGDGDRYNTTVVSDFSDPSVSMTCANLIATPFQGTRGVFTATYKDAHAANSVTSSSGDMNFTLTTAVVKSVDFTGGFRQFSKANIMIVCESIDGITPPLTLTVSP